MLGFLEQNLGTSRQAARSALRHLSHAQQHQMEPCVLQNVTVLKTVSQPDRFLGYDVGTPLSPSHPPQNSHAFCEPVGPLAQMCTKLRLLSRFRSGCYAGEPAAARSGCLA